MSKTKYKDAWENAENKAMFYAQEREQWKISAAQLQRERDEARARSKRLADELKQVLESPGNNSVIVQRPPTDIQAQAFRVMRETRAKCRRWKQAVKTYVKLCDKSDATEWTSDEPPEVSLEYGMQLHEAKKAMRDGDLPAIEVALGIKE